MSPIRVIILTILIYTLFRLLIGAGRRNSTGKTFPPGEGKDQAQDVLMEDPVCHTLIPARNAVTMKIEGKNLYFCSQNCRDRYTTKQPGEER